MNIPELLASIRRHLEQNVLGAVVDRIIVYGSQAEGVATEDSDYDILLVVTRPLSMHEHRALRAYLGILELRFGILMDVRLIPRADLATLRGKQPFILEALHKGYAA